MVKTLHSAGLEVILDVVYNHTAEGNNLGPTLSLKGIDNSTYYLSYPLIPAITWTTPARGTTLNMQHPRVLQLIMDSLRLLGSRYARGWFPLRFGRNTRTANCTKSIAWARFLDIIHQDPVLSQVKLIADRGILVKADTGGKFSRGLGGMMMYTAPRQPCVRTGRAMKGQWATSLIASPVRADLYRIADAVLIASINFVTAHDGFTLHDLGSAYNEKHTKPNRRK